MSPGIITTPPTKEGNIGQDRDKQREMRKKEYMEDSGNRTARNKYIAGRRIWRNNDIRRMRKPIEIWTTERKMPYVAHRKKQKHIAT